MANYSNYFIMSQNDTKTELTISFKQINPTHNCIVNDNGKIGAMVETEVNDVADIVVNAKDAEILYENLRITLGK